MRRFDRGMTNRGCLVSPSKPDGRAECLRTETVEVTYLNGRAEDPIAATFGRMWRELMPSAPAAAVTLPSVRASARCSTPRSAVARFSVTFLDEPRRSAAGSDFCKHACEIPSAWQAARVAPMTRSSASTAIKALEPLSGTGTTRMRASGYARRKYSASIRVAASLTDTAMRLTTPSVRSDRHDDTSSAAMRCPS